MAHAAKPSSEELNQTRQRLLEAAGELFAEEGFNGTTVREICRAARANVAAINYHFGSKEELYAAALDYWVKEAVKRYPPDWELAGGADARQRLGAFVRSLLFRVLDEGRPAWHGKLMAREMVEPTAGLDRVTRQTIRPMFDYLCQIVRELLGQRADVRQVRRCATSIVAQCLFYQQCRPMVSRLDLRQGFSGRELEELAGQITRFSLGGLDEIKKSRRSHGR